MKHVDMIAALAAGALALVAGVLHWHTGRWILSQELVLALSGFCAAALMRAKAESTQRAKHSVELDKARNELPPGIAMQLGDNDTTPIDIPTDRER